MLDNTEIPQPINVHYTAKRALGARLIVSANLSKCCYARCVREMFMDEKINKYSQEKNMLRLCARRLREMFACEGF
jgi:NADH:ubiquinone oxidoreductase subunit 2 (subunit N)